MTRRHVFTASERAEADLVLGVWSACEMGPRDRADLGVSPWGMILAEHAVDAVPDEMESYAGDAWFALIGEARSLLANGWTPGDDVDGLFRGLLEPEHCPCAIDGVVVMTNGRGVPLPPEAPAYAMQTLQEVLAEEYPAPEALAQDDVIDDAAGLL
jgi:hypothetical protein